MDAPPGVTQLLLEWQKGDRQALERLMPLVYDELRVIARRYLARERSGHTLQSTALVHEAYLKMVDQQHVEWQNRAQFFGIAATLMRRVLVDHARRHTARNAVARCLACRLMKSTDVPNPTGDVDLLVLDQALGRLEAIDPQQSRLVELAVFRRSHHRRSRSSPWRVHRYRQARLEYSKGLAVPGNEPSDAVDSPVHPSATVPNRSNEPPRTAERVIQKKNGSRRSDPRI